MLRPARGWPTQELALEPFDLRFERRGAGRVRRILLAEPLFELGDQLPLSRDHRLLLGNERSQLLVHSPQFGDHSVALVGHTQLRSHARYYVDPLSHGITWDHVRSRACRRSRWRRPEVRPFHSRKIDPIQQHRELGGVQHHARGAGLHSRNAESTLLEPLVEQHEASAVPNQNLPPVAPLPHECEQVAAE